MSNTKIVTPEFRVNFPKVFVPTKNEKGQENYELVMMFDKSTDIKALQEAVKKAAIEKFGDKALAEIASGKIIIPFYDGDEKDYDSFHGCICARAKTAFKPQVLDMKTKKLLESEDDFYSGCYAKASIVVYAGVYEKIKKYVKFTLQNVLKTRDGEHFGSRHSVYDDFGLAPIDDFNEASIPVVESTDKEVIKPAPVSTKSTRLSDLLG